MPLTFTCALRSGADYDAEDVYTLGKQVERAFTHSVDYVPVTDVPGLGLSLLHDTPWRWCLRECFRIPGPAMFVGLDTVIVGNLDPLYDFIQDLPSDEFAMIRPFNSKRSHGKYASGITAWNGDWSWLCDLFVNDSERIMNEYKFEQHHVCDCLEEKGVKVHEIQDHVDGIYSYKWHCQEELPSDARIVLFHGLPRPRDVNDLWVQEIRA